MSCCEYRERFLIRRATRCSEKSILTSIQEVVPADYKHAGLTPGVSVAIGSLLICVERGTSILHASFERSCRKAARPRNARAHPESAIDRRGGRPRRKS